jgi:hypothetical protein
VWWLRAADDAQLGASIEQLADAAGGLSASTPQETLETLVGAMRQPGLIVFDDAESLHAVKPYVEASGPTRVIVTTSSASPDSVLVRGLDPSNEVVRFVSARTGLAEKEALRLIEAVDGLPLLLLHACQFINANDSSVSDYLAILEKPSTIFETWPYQPLDYEGAQSRIIPLSLISLVETSAEWQRICALLPMLAPAPIPLALLVAFDGDAKAFVNAAQSSFVLIRNPKSQTVEVPTLIRGAIKELGIGEDQVELRRRAWQALTKFTSQEVSPSHLGYLAEHIAHLGVESDAASAAANLAVDLGERPLATGMWKHAYESAALSSPRRHSRWRVQMVEQLGWSMLKQGQYHEAERTVSCELALANEAGCIACRAPLLHLLAHLAEASRKPENEALRMFQATEAAMKICGEEDSELGQIFADIIFACRRRINEVLKEAETPVSELDDLASDGARAFLALQELKRKLQPMSSAGITTGTLRRWDSAEEAWRQTLVDLAEQQKKTGSQGVSEREQEEAERERVISDWTPSAAFLDLIKALLHRDYNVDKLADIGGRLGLLGTSSGNPEETQELAVALQQDSEMLREDLVLQYGKESHAIALADFVEMIAAHLREDERRAALACRQFLIGTLEATNMTRSIAFLHRGISFVLQPREGESHLDSYVIMTRGAPWLALLPDVEAFLWLSFEIWSESQQLPDRRNVQRAICEVYGLGLPGPSLAALLAHQYGHREHLPPTESLRYHRIAVRMYQKIGVPISDWGHALYCYAHRLLEVRQPDAATRRFVEAREMLTTVDSGSAAVRHIDEHLSSKIAPYLEDE